MPTTDLFGNRCDRLLRIHIRRISVVTYDVIQALRYAQRVYGPCGILVEMASQQSVSLPVETSREMTRLTLACSYDDIAEKQDELFGWFGVKDLSSITVFIVEQLKQRPSYEDVRGCAAHAPHQPAVYLSSLAIESTLAHELGHVLLTRSFIPKHSREPSNVMLDGALRISSSASPGFDRAQSEQLRKSPLLLSC